LETVGAGVAAGAVVALGAGVGFAATATLQARIAKRDVSEKNLVRIFGSNAFKSGRAKNKRFLCEKAK
jgi:hypothetical protein